MSSQVCPVCCRLWYRLMCVVECFESKTWTVVQLTSLCDAAVMVHDFVFVKRYTTT